MWIPRCEHAAGVLGVGVAPAQHRVDHAIDEVFPRHAEDDATRLVPHRVVAAGVMHLLHRVGAIGSHAGEHVAQRVRPDGVRDEVDGTELQLRQRRLCAVLGEEGGHHHWHRPQPHWPGKEIEPGRARHLVVERNDVRVQLADDRARLQCIGGRAHALHVGLAVDAAAARLPRTAHPDRLHSCRSWMPRPTPPLLLRPD